MWGDDNTLVWHLFWLSPLPGQGFCHFGWEFITLSSILISGMLRFFPLFFLYDVTHVACLLDPMFCTGPLCSFPDYPWNTMFSYSNGIIYLILCIHILLPSHFWRLLFSFKFQKYFWNVIVLQEKNNQMWEIELQARILISLWFCG